jgi:hypothetical protein
MFAAVSVTVARYAPFFALTSKKISVNHHQPASIRINHDGGSEAGIDAQQMLVIANSACVFACFLVLS